MRALVSSIFYPMPRRGCANAIPKKMFLVLVIFALGGCNIAPDTSMSFDGKSAQSLVIGGIDTSGNSSIAGIIMTFRAYDKEKQRLIPGADQFTVFHTSIHDGLSAKPIAPGHYAFTNSQTFYSDGPIYGRIRDSFIKTPDKGVFLGFTDDARIGGSEVYRFEVKPGEAVYLGEYEIGVFKPRWVSREDELRELMAQMKNVSVIPTFRPPQLRTE